MWCLLNSEEEAVMDEGVPSEERSAGGALSHECEEIFIEGWRILKAVHVPWRTGSQHCGR